MKKFRRSLIFAIVIYGFDVFILNQGAIAFFVGAGALIGGVPRTLFALIRGRKEIAWERFIRTVIYVLMAVLVVVSNRLNNDLAFNRAEQVIQACEQYREQYQRYPDDLQALVPAYLPKVPSAKVALAYRDFLYISNSFDHLLVFYSFPPFDRMIYRFEEKKWGMLD